MSKWTMFKKGKIPSIIKIFVIVTIPKGALITDNKVQKMTK